MDKWHIEDAAYQRWLQEVEAPWRETLNLPDTNAYADERWPLISIVMPTYDTPGQFLQQAIDSIRSQSYPKWQLCIADDASNDPRVREIIGRYLELDSRILATFRKANGGIAAASNSALALASGQYIALVDHDDELPEHALALMARELQSHPDTKLLYSDSDNLNADGQRCNPFFKPDWNYDLFLAQNYLNHLSIYKKCLMDEIGGFRENFEGSQDYDLALRSVEAIPHGQIRHIPRILYHWRVVPSAVSQSNLGKAVNAARRALDDHFARTNQAASACAATNAIIYNRVAWRVPIPLPSVLILLIEGQDDLISESTVAASSLTRYGNFRVESLVDRKQVSRLSLADAINTEIENAREDLLCIMHASFVPESADWLQSIAGQLSRHKIGAVGPKLLSSGGEVLGNHLITATSNAPDSSGLGRAFEGASRTDKGYFGHLMLDQQVSALHGACLATRRADYISVGGFNSDLSDLALLGADYCFKLAEIGLGTTWLASTVMQCPERVAASVFQARPARGELSRFLECWPRNLQGDPFYNANFSTSHLSYHL